MEPFLKWPGGKRWLAHRLAPTINAALRRCYFEPFLGGGALYFAVQPKAALLSDINGDLVNVYNAVKTCHRDIETQIRRMPVDAATYARVRSRNRLDPAKRAADFLYLNRTAWGGIYRLNSAGHFNVPFGGGARTPSRLWEQKLLGKASAILAQAQIRRIDFELALAKAGTGDVVYCDPTYTVAHDRNGFVRYNEHNFCWADQIRLSRACFAAAKRGATVLISNAYHRSIKALYVGARSIVYERRSLVSPRPVDRRLVREFVFMIEPRK